MSTATCGGCPQTWTALRACHCSGCHRLFSGLTLFDVHRARGRCVDPSDIPGAEYRDGMWRKAVAETRWWERAAVPPS